MQQSYREVEALVSLLLRHFTPSERQTLVEIGLGHYGSSHVLWRELFQRVVTIERVADRANEVIAAMEHYLGEESVADRRSWFVVGSSHDPATVQTIYDEFPTGVDALFIDGNHAYAAVLCDWLLYHPLVRPGGLVMFHDSACAHPSFGVKPVVALLERGLAGCPPAPMYHIVHSDHMGVSYYVKPSGGL